MRAIPISKRNRISTLLEEGYSSRAIAFRVKVSHSTVLRIKHLKEQTGCLDVLPRSGRPRILTNRHERRIARQLRSGTCSNAIQTQKKLTTDEGVRVSANTIRRALWRQGLQSRVKKKKPLLQPRTKRLRREFAKKYRNWTVEDWRRVIFSDESKFKIFGSDGREWCWKDPNSPLLPQHVKPTVKFGGGSVMVWGCMGMYGVGNYCRIEGNMNKNLYAEILKDELSGTMRAWRLTNDDFIFQHDNDPKHTSGVASDWLDEKGIEVLTWPPYSPDLNPIEHLWDEVDRRLRQLPGNISSETDLWNKIQKVWNEIDDDYVLKLIDTMPQRIKDVLKAKGGYTGW